MVNWSGIIKSQLIQIVEWDNDAHDSLAWRFPVHGNEIKNGAKLVVREGQSAIFVNEGKMADVFGPGTYTLSTENLPILSTLKGWKYGFSSPFKAEVYFVSTTQFTNLRWGTQNPIMVRDPEFGPMRLRAHGSYTLRVTDPAVFLREVVGTDSNFEVDEIIGQVKQNLIQRFTSGLSSAQVPALDLASNYDGIVKKVLPLIREDFKSMGIDIPAMTIANISLPPAVEKALDTRSEMSILGNMNQFAAYQMANAIPDAAKAENSMAAQGMGLAAGMNMGGQMANMMHPQMGQGMMGQPQMGMGMGFQGAQPGVMAGVGMMPQQPGMPQQPPQQAPQAAAGNSMVERIQKLDALKAAGVLSDEEYTQKRNQILSEI